MSNYREHALTEFRAAGWTDENGVFKDGMQKAICNHALKLLDVFAEEGHSGSSAPYAVNLFKKLALFETVAPLTGEDWEWNLICDERTNGVEVYQNKRCSAVFKQTDRFGGQPYYLEAVVFWEWHRDSETGEPYKCYYTSRDSSQTITFPYSPKTEYVYHSDDTTQNEEGFL